MAPVQNKRKKCVFEESHSSAFRIPLSNLLLLESFFLLSSRFLLGSFSNYRTVSLVEKLGQKVAAYKIIAATNDLWLVLWFSLLMFNLLLSLWTIIPILKIFLRLNINSFSYNRAKQNVSYISVNPFLLRLSDYETGFSLRKSVNYSELIDWFYLSRSGSI